MADENSTISNPGSESADAQKRRRRRGSRGGRGRSRGRPQGGTPVTASTPVPSDVVADEAADVIGAEVEFAHDAPELAAREADLHGAEAPMEHDEPPAEAPMAEPFTPVPVATSVPEREPMRPPERPVRHERPQRPPPREIPPARPAPHRPGSAVAEAVEDVYRIIEALKKVMDDLDEVLETLELAERQKMEDERELDKLRSALRQLQPRSTPAPQRPVPQHSRSHHHERHSRPSQPQSARSEEIREPAPAGGEAPPQT